MNVSAYVEQALADLVREPGGWPCVWCTSTPTSKWAFDIHLRLAHGSILIIEEEPG